MLVTVVVVVVALGILAGNERLSVCKVLTVNRQAALSNCNTISTCMVQTNTEKMLCNKCVNVRMFAWKSISSLQLHQNLQP
jgi:hypothetical protein